MAQDMANRMVLSIANGDDERAMIAQLTHIAKDMPVDTRPTFMLELEEPYTHYMRPRRIPVHLSLVGHAEDLSTRQPHTWFIIGTIPDSSLVSNDWLVPYRLFRGVYNPVIDQNSKGFIEPNDAAWPDLLNAVI